MKKKINFKAMEPMLVPIEKLEANDYNPNKVMKTEMDLLKTSIIQNGFTFPIVTIYDKENDKYVIIDGFHRHLALKELGSDIACIVVLEHSIEKRMSATIQFNRARGVHQVEEMSNLVIELTKLNVSNEEIAKQLGMEAEEIIRLKSQLGVADFYKNHAYSMSWEKE